LRNEMRMKRRGEGRGGEGGGYVDVCRIATKEGERVGVLVLHGLRHVDDDDGDIHTSVRAYAYECA